MSMEFWFHGQLEYGSQRDLDAVKRELKEEGCAKDPDNVIRDQDLHWKGKTLSVDMRGSMPYACFEISSFVLGIYARHATKGELVCLNVEDGCGEKYPAGGDGDELEESEVEALRAKYRKG